MSGVHPTLEGVRSAAARISPYLPETPFFKSDFLSETFGAEVWIKNETTSPIASFKVRGAINVLLAAKADGATYAVTSSTGNHGQGVAYAARLLGMKARIFMPNTPNAVKRDKIQRLGAEIETVGRDLDEAKEVAKRWAASSEAVFVDDGESLLLMEGAGTVALEMLLAVPTLDALLVPTGSGTLVSGVGTVAKALAPRSRVYAVQAKGSPAMVESFRARRPIEREIVTIADGLMCRVPARLAFETMCAVVSDALLATDEALLGAMRTYVEGCQLLTEPSGAAALAGLAQVQSSIRGARIGLIATGANVDSVTLARALETPAVHTSSDPAVGLIDKERRTDGRN